MAAANTPISPFDITPAAFLNTAQAQQPAPMAGRVAANSNGLSGGNNQNVNSPMQQQLLSNLQSSLNPAALPNLMSQLLNNPSLAAQVGGFADKNEYTPDHPANAWRSTYVQPGPNSNGPADFSFGSTNPLTGMQTQPQTQAPAVNGYSYGQGGQSMGMANLWNGIPINNPAMQNPNAGVPVVPTPYANNPQYQAWLQSPAAKAMAAPAPVPGSMSMNVAPPGLDINDPATQQLLLKLIRSNPQAFAPGSFGGGDGSAGTSGVGG